MTPTGNPSVREIRAIRVLPETLAVNDGDSTRLVATVFDQLGVAFSQLPAPARLAWSSSAPAVALVDSSGLVSGLRPGTAAVTAGVLGVGVPLSLSAQVVVRAVPTALAPLSGDSQTAAAGTRLPQDLRVKVTDRHGDGVPGVTVTFAVSAGRGTLGADSAVTDAAGMGAVALTLDTLVGFSVVQARAARLPQALVQFHAQGRPGAVTRLAIVSGDAQGALTGAVLTAPLVVRASDRYNNAAPGVAVSWQVTAGGGSVAPATGVTDTLGLAQATWTMGAASGPQAVRATVVGGIAAGFAASARARVVSVTVVPASATVALDSTRTFAATPRDGAGVALAGRPVVWSSSDTLKAAIDTAGRLTARGLGTVTVTATVEGVSGTAAVTVTPGPISPTTSPVSVSGATVASGASVTLTLRGHDVHGNPVVTGGRTVVFTASGGTSTGTIGATADSGNGVYVASFTGARAGTATAIGATIDGVAVTMTAPSVTVTPGDASQLTFTAQPAGAAAGVGFGATVAAFDAQGNAATAFAGPVALALTAGTGPAGAHLLGTTSVTAAAGVATFTGLSLDSAAAGYTLTASAAGLPSATSAVFAVGPGAVSLSRSLVTAARITVASGDTVTVTLRARDGFGNALTSGGLTVTFAASGGTSTGAFGQVSDHGDGTYTALFTATAAGTPATIGVTIGGVAATGTLPTVTVVPGRAAPSQSVVTVARATVASGDTVTVALWARDGQGNALTSGGRTVVFTATGGTGTGTIGPTADSGNGVYVASFTGVHSGTATAIGATIDGVAVTTPTPSLTVTPGDASQLTFTTQPAGAAAGVGFGATVAAFDAQGNAATAFGGSVGVALTAGTGPAGAHLLGTTSIAAVAGVAVFTGISIDSAGAGYTVTASAAGLPIAISTSFAVGAGAPSLAHSAVSVARATVASGDTVTVTLRARDGFGNVLTTGGLTVAFAASGGTSTGTFGAVTDHADGSYSATLTGVVAGTPATVGATVGGAAVTSALPTLTVVPGPAAPSQSVVTAARTTVSSGDTMSVSLRARDAQGNALTSGGLAIAFSVSGGTSTGTFGGVTDRGDGTYTALFTGTAAGTPATIGATIGGAAVTGTLPTLSVTPGAAARLAFTVQPPAAQATQVLTPAVAVTVRDAHGNTVPSWSSAVSVALGANPGAATLGGTLSHAVSAGVATFADLTVTTGGAGYTLVASSAGLPPDTSAAFTVTGTAYPMTIDVVGPDIVGLGLTNPLDITLSQPAGPGGATLTVTSSDASLVTAADPGTVLIPEGQTTGRIVLNGLALGSATVHVGAQGYVSASLPVHVTDVVNAVVQDSLSAGVFGTCAIRPSGSLYCWGHATPPTRLVTALGFVAVSAGDTHQCALKADGTAYCWGDNSLGQLGDGSLTPSPTPVAVAGNLRFARIRAGQGYTCGLTIGGGVYCWGDSAHVGRLGLFISNSALVPTAVIGGQTFADLSIDPTFHACALTTGGEAYCWGANSYGDIGDGTQIPRTVPTAVHAGVARFQEIAAGGGDVVGPFTCALTAAGEVYCWGSNVDGELGLNPASLFSAWIPVRSAAGPYVSLAAGGGTVCAVTAAGTAECWGRNLTGQIGDGTISDRFTPTLVPGVAFGRISVGTYHTCGTSTTGELWCWGSNQSGQLGAFLGNPAARSAPVKVNPGPPATMHITGPASAVAGQTIAPAVTVSAKDAFGDAAGVAASPVTIALGANPGSATLGGTTTATVSGGAAAFGNLTISAAGSGYTLVASYPGIPADTGAPFTVTAPLVVPPVPLSAGVAHACEIRSGGAVWCWGANAAGQLGDGGTSDAALPVAVSTGQSFVGVSAGDDHSCALTNAGAAWCWGGNAVGQLGTGGTSPSLTPAAVAGGLAFVQILAGSGFTCGLTGAGSAYCWGGNGGKLGDGNPASNPLSPQAVSGGLTFTTLSLFGNNHACGIEVGGKAYCWGYNYDGELGDGTQSDRYVPTAVAGVGYYSAIAAATFHSCALTATGAAFCWGDNNVSQLGWGSPPTDQLSPGAVGGGYVFTSLATGGGHTCGLRSSGAAICWGYNAEGALGDGSQTTRLAPAPVSGGLTFARLALGDNFSCGQTSTGETWCWGINTSGQLGDATHAHRLVPVRVGVVAPVATVVVAPAASSLSIAATVQLVATPRDADGNSLAGRPVSWASSDPAVAAVDAGGLVVAVATGAATITATSEGVNGMATITVMGAVDLSYAGVVSAGYHHTCDVRSNLTLNCWGYNDRGRLGNGNNTNQTAPALVASALQFFEVAVGYDHTCGLAADSTAYCWGVSVAGQGGNGSIYGSYTPFPVQFGLHFAQIVAGFQNTCARTAAGDVWCWGADFYDNRLSPVRLGALPPLVTISLSEAHVCGLTATGQGYCWGKDGSGQTGDGFSPHNWNDARMADSVVGGLTFISIAAGTNHSCAVAAGGDAYCWGDNSSSQLGRSTSENSNPVPGLVQGGHAFASVYAGYDHSCGLLADGTAYCWGTGAFGQLGNADRVTLSSPVPVSGGLRFSVLTLGTMYTCGRTLGGQLYCWGLNDFGQLGLGNTAVWDTPRLVH